jgi:hypothetical protein
VTLFLVSPAAADWTDPSLDTLLPVTTSVIVQTTRCNDPSSECFDESDPYRGPKELDVIGEDVDVYLFEPVEITVTVEVTEDMPLPIQIRVVLGGPGYKSAPRNWTLYSPGIYSTKSYFVASSVGSKQAGAKILVRWDPDGQCAEGCEEPYRIDSNTILNAVEVTNP